MTVTRTGGDDEIDPWRDGLIDKATEQAISRAIGRILRDIRRASDLKLGQLADQCEISQSVLCRVELARQTPGIPLLLTVCAKLGIRLSDLIRGAEDQVVPDLFTSREGRFHELTKRARVTPGSQAM